MATDPKTNKELVQEDRIKANAIMHAVETASNFQLYSYRIIDDKTFIKRQLELSQQLVKAAK